MNDGVARISGCVQHPQVGPHFTRGVGQLPAVKAARQPDIGKQKPGLRMIRQ